MCCVLLVPPGRPGGRPLRGNQDFRSVRELAHDCSCEEADFKSSSQKRSHIHPSGTIDLPKVSVQQGTAAKELLTNSLSVLDGNIFLGVLVEKKVFGKLPQEHIPGQVQAASHKLSSSFLVWIAQEKSMERERVPCEKQKQRIRACFPFPKIEILFPNAQGRAVGIVFMELALMGTLDCIKPGEADQGIQDPRVFPLMIPCFQVGEGLIPLKAFLVS